MVKKLILATTILLALTATVYAKGKPLVQMSVASYQQIIVKNKQGHIKKDKHGKPIKKWVKAKKVIPGHIVKYIDTITNDSNATLKNADINNPINKNLLFISGSVKSAAHVSVKYSVNGGKSFDVPDKLMVRGKDKKMHRAKEKDYNAIAFTIEEVPANSKVKVSYKVKLK